MKKIYFLIIACLLCCNLTAMADTKAGSWDLTKESADWTASGNVSYLSQPYGFKQANGTLMNKSIPDFSAAGITKIWVGFKCLQNGANTSKITIYLVDKNGNTIGSGLTMTPHNESDASKTSYLYATFMENFEGATGFMMKVSTFGADILVNAAEYEVRTAPLLTPPHF